MRSHNCEQNYMKLPCIICNVNIYEITNQISVRPIMVRRVSVSSAHLAIVKMYHFSLCYNLEECVSDISWILIHRWQLSQGKPSSIYIVRTMRRKRPRLCLSILHLWIMPSSENIEKTAAVDWRHFNQNNHQNIIEENANMYILFRCSRKSSSEMEAKHHLSHG